MLNETFSVIFKHRTYVFIVYFQPKTLLLLTCLWYFCFNIESDIELDEVMLPKRIFACIQDFFYLKGQDTWSYTLFKKSNFCPKIQLWFHEKNCWYFLGVKNSWKCCGFIDNFNFTRKIVKKKKKKMGLKKF